MIPLTSASGAPSWFDTPARVAALRSASERWAGTPFFANSEARGRDGGVDCVHLIRAIILELGVVAPFEIPLQVMDWGSHGDRSLLLEALETWPALTARYVRLTANEKEPAPGDILCLNGGHVPHHAALMLDRGQILHALRPEGVYVMQLAAVIRARRVLGTLDAIYRPLPDGVSRFPNFPLSRFSGP